MEVKPLSIPDVLLIEPRIFRDSRGYFLESFNLKRYEEAGIPASEFVQDNISFSTRGVLRGLHFQRPNAQGKLIQAIDGEILDVAVDVRPGSKTFGRWLSQLLTSETRNQLWVPAGFAHGFFVRSETALVSYKCVGYYQPAHEQTLLWDDPTVGIDWGFEGVIPTLSDKDRAGLSLHEVSAHA